MAALVNLNSITRYQKLDFKEEFIMSEKAKTVLKRVGIAVLAILVVVNTVLMVFVIDYIRTEQSKPLIDENMLVLQQRVSCLEHGENYDDVLIDYIKEHPDEAENLIYHLSAERRSEVEKYIA